MQLDSVYLAPGALFVASGDDDERLGCIGLRSLGSINGVVTGEIRRLFVRESGRGQGIGRSLVDRLTHHATAVGFERLVLNTLPSMHEARSLYRLQGFRPTTPYVEEPLDDIVYLDRMLENPSSRSSTT